MKKILLGLGSITAVAAPIAAVVSCNDDAEIAAVVSCNDDADVEVKIDLQDLLKDGASFEKNFKAKFKEFQEKHEALKAKETIDVILTNSKGNTETFTFTQASKEEKKELEDKNIKVSDYEKKQKEIFVKMKSFAFKDATDAHKALIEKVF